VTAAAAWYVNDTALLVKSWLLNDTSTACTPTPAAAGDAHSSSVAVTYATDVRVAIAPNRQYARSTLTNAEPVTVTPVPPATGPIVGVSAVMAGGV
jgi:hypothetical protein